MNQSDTLETQDSFGVTIGKSVSVKDELKYDGRFEFRCDAPVEHRREEFIKLRDAITKAELETHSIVDELVDLSDRNFIVRFFKRNKIKALNQKLNELRVNIGLLEYQKSLIPLYIKWEDGFDNLITTVGKNNMLDNHFAGSSYTAAWYMGLIDNASFTAVAAADTMASHAGWIESAAYSNSTRIACAWSAASGGVKSLSAALGFTINGTATLNGGFINSVSTKSGTTGTLTSAGSFSGGTRAVINGDTVNASYSATLT
jgi:hypothetical protein